MNKYFILIFGILLYFTSCDIVETPYMNNENINPIDTNSTSYVKKVLIEDFTGHKCPNCPAAANEIEAIHNIYDDQIIAIAIHVSSAFARPDNPSQSTKYLYDFRTIWGDDLDNFFEISNGGLPIGMVNRTGYSNNHKLNYEQWANAVTNELNKDVDFGIIINSNSNNINISTEILNNISGSYNLVVCLTESGIINWQKNGTEDIEDYEHNHVLRSVLTDELLSNNNSYQSGQEIEKSINYDLTSLEQNNIDYSQINPQSGPGYGNAGNWNADNMSVIAYIYNNNTKEIIQVEEAYLNN